jgi:hypothetical protein
MTFKNRLTRKTAEKKHEEPHTVHVVLFVGGGIPDNPEVFNNEPDAMDRYREIAKKQLGIASAGVGDMTDDELFEAVRNRENADDDLYLYDGLEVR